MGVGVFLRTAIYYKADSAICGKDIPLPFTTWLVRDNRMPPKLTFYFLAVR